MALLWAESFDLYGSSATYLSQRPYNYCNSPGLTTGAGARTGNGYLALGAGGGNSGLGRTLDAAVTVLGQGVGMSSPGLGADSVNNQALTFGQTSAPATIRVSPNNALGLNVYQGSTLKGVTPPNLFTLNTWFWVEAKVTCNTGGANTGSVEVRYNGAQVLLINGLDIPTAWTNCGLGQPGGGWGNSNSTVWFDDWIVWDNSGTINNNFFGDCRCSVGSPSSNGASQDWTPSTPPAWSCIHETTPNDADYVSATAAGNISTFGVTPIPFPTNIIKAVIPVVRALKTDTGAATYQLGLSSAGVNSMSADISPGVTASYASKIFELDPNGNIPWLFSTANAALLRLSRTA